jgi:hypothetical protein
MHKGWQCRLHQLSANEFEIGALLRSDMKLDMAIPSRFIPIEKHGALGGTVNISSFGIKR